MPDDQIQTFAHQVYVMRCAQRNYFQARDHDSLKIAKQEEKKVDAMIARVRTGGPVMPDTQSSFLNDAT